MPKVIFEFDLSEEQTEYEVFAQSRRMQTFLWDFSQQLRAWCKYDNQFKDADDALNNIREEFYRLADDNKVNLDL